MTGPQAISEVKRLSPQSGDVLVFRLEEDTPQNRQAVYVAANLITSEMKKQGKEIYGVLLLPGTTLELLDEDAMRSAGWVRIPNTAFAV